MKHWIQPLAAAMASARSVMLGCATVWGGLLAAASGLAQAPPDPQDAPPPPPRVRPETPELQAAADALRQHMKKMREVWVRYNTNLDKSQDQTLREQWFELERSGLPLHANLVTAALNEYQTDPPNKSALADMLWRILDRNVEEDRYEGMLPVAQALLANDYPEEKLVYNAAMTAFAVADFTALRPLLNQLAIDGQSSPMLMAVQQDLDTLQQWWEEEQAARQADAAGEPLPRVMIHTTKGDIEVELFENQAPETVANFIHLAESGFYEGQTFHRVLEHFMAQTGCPIGDGTGGPGYTIYNEKDKPGARKFFRGTLGMALSEDPNSAGSQFFITFVPTYQLNAGFTAFGRVISGMEVLSNIVRVNPEEKKDDSEPAEMLDEIISIEVLSKRDHAYEPNRVQ